MNTSNSKQTLCDEPLVTICIPAYNVEKTVVQTVRSILNQTYHNMEILVVDNDSRDNTLLLLREFNDSRMKIYKNSKNIGAERNFDRCVQLANGEYIAIFHADDVYRSDIVQKQVQAFQDNPTIGAVFTFAELINESGEVIGEYGLPVKLRGKRIYHFREIFFSMLENGDFLFCPSAMVKSALYKELVPFEERFGTSADTDMKLRILEKCPIVILPEKLMSYRIHNTHTRSEDYLNVMDYYLSVKSSILNIPHSVLNKYKSQRSKRIIRGAKDYLIKGQLQDAKQLLLREPIFTTVFWGANAILRSLSRKWEKRFKSWFRYV